jgi:toxin ParE1/3/4
VSARESLERADALLDRVERTLAGLARFPLRGDVTPELARVGVTDAREVHVGPYRLLYQMERRVVLLLAVLDGRRDHQDLLARRLLR